MREWQHKTDPHEIVPVGFRSQRNRYTVAGFCSPAGEEPIHLMVYIRYDGDKGEYSTTLRYLSVLYDYFNSIDLHTFVEKHIMR